MNPRLETISELQSKAEVFFNRLMDAKEFVMNNPSKKLPVKSSSLLKSSIIDLSVIAPGLFEEEEPFTIDIDLEVKLEELKRKLFKIDRIADDDRHIKTRKREIVMSRQIIMSVFHRVFKPLVTLHSAGDLYGMDHATVIHACKTINNLRETDAMFEVMYSSIWKWAKKQNENFTLVDKTRV